MAVQHINSTQCHKLGARLIRNKSAAIVLLLASLGIAGESVAEEEVIVADVIRAAFYESAPRSIVAPMRSAVAMACAERSATEGWLCGGQPLRFLRAVLVDGTRSPNGSYVCRGSDEDNVKFFTAEMVEDCAPLTFYYDSKQYSLDLDDLIRREAEQLP